ncbi:MAG: OsmC family protein [Hyphomicrobiaceae bacterium]|nr:OsmC family protein [Hyphomicrobiaceae bacterium]
MDAEALKNLQAPIKDKYREDPDTAVITLKAQGRLGDGVTCSVETGQALVEAGLHPATGGSGVHACSGDMLLEALVACAGVTMSAVATALELKLSDAKVKAEGDLDFKGTLGVDREEPVGFKAIRLSFDIEGDLGEDEIATLMKLTERYCVVYQTLASNPSIQATHSVV